MPVEVAIWKITPQGPEVIPYTALAVEKKLEDMIVADPSLVGLDLLVVGRQVATDFGGFIDVLAMDQEGRLHVFELKRDKTPRDVIAQLLDYGSWVVGLGVAEVEAIYAKYFNGDLATAFAEKFDVALPEVVNREHQLTVVASYFDPASERIVEYLANLYAVPVNAVFFRHFLDGQTEYLTRSWLLDPHEVVATTAKIQPKGKPWNGTDYYVVLGRVDDDSYRWRLAIKYGFVGAGGGTWYWRPLKNLDVGKRVFGYVGGAGYIGIGEITGPLTRLADLKVESNGTEALLIDMDDVPSGVRERALSPDEAVTEYAVPVKWHATRHPDKAVKAKGLFANQATVCRLTDDRTIEIVSKELGVS